MTTLSMLQALADALPALDVRDDGRRPGPWLAGDAETPFLAVVEVGGRPCLWHVDRVREIAADLDAAAPLLEALEGAAGWRFEPDRVIDEARPALLLRDVAGGIALRIAADLPPPAALRHAAAATMPTERPYPRGVTLQGPALDVAEADALAPGDLLLLPAVAGVRIDGVDDPWVLELATGRLERGGWSEGIAPARFAVPIAVVLPSVALSGDALAARTPIMLGPLVEGTPVALEVGSRRLGEGIVVRLGQALAVRLTILAAQEAAA